MIPRIRGNVWRTKHREWVYTIWLTDMSVEKVSASDEIGTFGPFATEEKAMSEMRSAVRLVCDRMEVLLGKLQVSDMSLNTIRKWDEH